MKVLCADQRSDDWFEVKKGRISASDAHKCLMGRHTKGRRTYIEKIADDLEGIPDFADEDRPPWFTDGVYYESWARGWYSFRYDIDVIETGFVVHDEYDWIGCSPDGLLHFEGIELAPGITYLPNDEQELLEIKYRKSLRTFQDHAVNKFTTAHHAQMQCQLFVTGCQRLKYVNYWRSDDHELERGHVQTVHRDEAYIQNTLLPGILTFWDDVAEEMERRKLQRQRAVS